MIISLTFHNNSTYLSSLTIDTRSLPRLTLLGKMICFIASLGKVHLGLNGRPIYTGKGARGFTKSESAFLVNVSPVHD